MFVSSFLAEYTNIVLMSTLLAVLFLGGYTLPPYLWPTYSLVPALVMGVKSCVGCFSIVWARAVLPRVTFITLLQACWTYLLPLAIALLLFYPSLLVAFDAVA